MCSDTSGYISNILLAVGDEANLVYTSGTVNQLIFAKLPMLNGLMGTCFSGDSTVGCITPSISGTVYQSILELLISKELTKRSMYTASRTFTLTSFKEGDSSVNVSDQSKYLHELYKQLQSEFDRIVNQTKYSIASNAVTTVIGTDASIQETIPYIQYGRYYPNY